jgi:bacterioferritin
MAIEFAQPDEDLLRELQRAYADEWFAHYNYYIASRLVTGPSAASVAALLRDKSDEAFRRADLLAQRLVELGETPTPKLTDLVDAATDKPFKLPDDLSDIEGLLRAVLDAERTSMRTHRSIHAMTRDSDPLTADLALYLLRQAAEGEQLLEKLLGGSAPEMTGT